MDIFIHLHFTLWVRTVKFLKCFPLALGNKAMFRLTIRFSFFGFQFSALVSKFVRGSTCTVRLAKSQRNFIAFRRWAGDSLPLLLQISVGTIGGHLRQILDRVPYFWLVLALSFTFLLALFQFCLPSSIAFSSPPPPPLSNFPPFSSPCFSPLCLPPVLTCKTRPFLRWSIASTSPSRKWTIGPFIRWPAPHSVTAIGVTWHCRCCNGFEQKCNNLMRGEGIVGNAFSFHLPVFC